MSSNSKPQILLVEDNLEFAETIKEFIDEFSKYKIVHYSSGKLALEYLNQKSSEVIGICSDLLMKDMDGIDFLAQIRKSKVYGNLPLIFISGASPMVFKSLLEPYDYSGFIEKPINYDKLVGMIEMTFPIPKNKRVA